jgi:RHS repeat-associated protein
MYDYLGRRIQKIVYTTADWESYTTLVAERYIYDGWNVIAVIDTSGNYLKRQGWGLDISGSIHGTGGIGGLVVTFDDDNSGSYSPTYDGNGNVVAMVDLVIGNIDAEYEYTPFGEATRAEGDYAASNPYRFSTKWLDQENNFHYYGYRYYDARNGRFMNRDPLGEAGGQNLYQAFGGDPVNRVDVLGLVQHSDCFWYMETNEDITGDGEPDWYIKEDCVYWDDGLEGNLYGDRESSRQQLIEQAAYWGRPYSVSPPIDSRRGGWGIGGSLIRSPANDGFVVTFSSMPGDSIFVPDPKNAAFDSIGDIPLVGDILIGTGQIASEVGLFALDWVGEVWNAPNTAIGLTVGTIGWLFGGEAPVIRENAIVFGNNPLAFLGAITLGNTIIIGPSYGPTGPDTGLNYPLENGTILEHEMQHTYQGELLGPLYIPSNILGLGAGILFNWDTHGPANWNEVGPESDPPTPWP